MRGEGERGGGGANTAVGRGNRASLPARTHLRGAGASSTVGDRERAQSPIPAASVDVPLSGSGLERERGEQFKSGRSVQGSSGTPSGGKYKPDDRKIPRLKNARHSRGGVDSGGDKERGAPVSFFFVFFCAVC